MIGLINLMTQVPDYIENFVLMSSNKDLILTYVAKSYDLVDKDLDFDEEYYNKVIENLQSLVLVQCKTVLNNLNLTQVKIIFGNQMMRNTTKTVVEILITKDETHYRYPS